ncbi:MAG: hypothetical protein L3J29_09950, partial [Cyclobacteriaceae bacterium]|nr:hypothetical protein [Cyclobacteriaceae bacterium]
MNLFKNKYLVPLFLLVYAMPMQLWASIGYNPNLIDEVNTVADHTEFLALKALYESTNGANWTNNTGWPTAGNWPATATATEMGTWFGVIVTNGDVTQVILPNNNLNGILSGSLGNLSELSQLKLNSNQIGGSIPVSIGSLQKLVILLLYNNLLTGNIPVEIGNLANLVSLQLQDNVFTGTIPASLGNCTKLKFFYIRNANMSGSIPSSFENLTKLQVLFISNCGIDGELPAYLGNFPNLNNIYLFGNKFTGSIPENWQNLNNLQQLILHNNQLSGEFPLWLKNKSTITALYLGNNTFTGSLTDFIGDWPNLSALHLTGLGLAGPIPESIGNLTSLQILYLNSNNFTSSPDFTAHPNVSNLRVYVQNNNLPFSNIEQNFSSADTHPFSVFNFNPQSEYGLPSQLTISPGTPATFSANMPGQYNTYQWQKNTAGTWINIVGATNAEFIINDPQPADETQYRSVVSNTWVTGMSITTAPITLGVQASNMVLTESSSADSQGLVTTTFNWTPEPGATTYILALKDLATDQWQSFENIATTTFERNDLIPNSKYQWYIDAIQGTVTTRSSLKNFTTPQFGVTAPWLAGEGFMFGREANPLNTSYVLDTLNEGNQYSVFASPPCIEGQYYIAYQMEYDLGDLSTENVWESSAQISLWEDTTKLWSNKVYADMETQTFLSTIFHDSTLTCDAKYTFTIDSIWNTGSVPLSNIVIRQQLYRADTLLFTNNAVTTFEYIKLQANTFRATWSFPQDEIEEYDLEWVYIDEEEGFTGNTPAAAFGFKEGVRVTKSAPFHEFQSYYPNGNLWFRVRAIGNNVEFPSHRILGTWQYGAGTPLTITNHQANINWQTQTSFAEEGKSKTVMAYADGSGRVRQQVTGLTTDKHAVVAETLYDYEGRPVVQTLPVPVADDVLGYRSNFNNFESTDPLITANTSAIRNKFFYDNTALENGTLTTTAGAGRYYSPANNVPGIHANYIPQSNGYAYSQVSYVNDNTGRVRKQSGVGSQFRIDDYHTTRNYYGEPAPAELIRLFGSNTGNANRYKKNLVVDPNGQVSVSYVDQAERVVATSLAGASPLNVDALASLNSLPATTINVNITPKNRIEDGASVLEHTILNVAPATEYNFDYDFSALASQVDEIGCEACNYTLTMSVTGPNGSEFDLSGVAGNEATVGNGYVRAINAASCDDPTLISDIQFALIFPEIGEYTISKKLVAHELSFEQVRTLILREASVITEIELIESQYVIDSTSCDNCTACSPADSVAVINEAMNLIVINDCENIKENIRQALISEGILPTEPAIIAHADYCAYTLCTKNKASEVFDRDLMMVSNWSEAVAQNYTNALALDPFFDAAGTLSGAGSATSMQTKLDNISLGTIEVDANGDGIPESSTDITGTISEVTDPLNTSYYINENGELNISGKHLLYYNLQDQLAQGWITQAEYDSTVNINRWQMYRGFYTEAKRVTKLGIIEIASCPAAVALLQQQSSAGIMDSVNASDYENDPVSLVQLETTISSIQFACDTTLTTSDSTAIANHLETYFNNSPNNYFFLLFKTDLIISPELQAINTILSGYACGLDSLAEEDNPLECIREITITVPRNIGQIINENNSQETNVQGANRVSDSTKNENLQVANSVQNDNDRMLDSLLFEEERAYLEAYFAAIQAEESTVKHDKKALIQKLPHLVEAATNSVPQVEDDEIAALVQLRNAVGGELLTKWADESNVGAWEGVTVSGVHVTELNTSTLYIPTSIIVDWDPAPLTELEILNTHYNIKIELSKVSSLTKLTILWVNCTGALSTLTNLLSLKELIISGGVSGNISSLESLTQLETIVLNDFNFEGNLSSFSNLTKLEKLQIGYSTEITGNINSLSNLPLTDLILSGPLVEGSIDVFSSNTTFERIYLSFMPNVNGSILSLENKPLLRSIIFQNTAVEGDMSIWDVSELTNL